jgi:glycosyltransferase involved in cell wall biosynthesis
MRRGIPVLATPEVGMSEVVRATGAGVVVDGAPSSIAAGLKAMLADEARSRAMGEVGRAHVIANHGWRSVARRMSELYGTVLKQRDRPATVA